MTKEEAKNDNIYNSMLYNSNVINACNKVQGVNNFMRLPPRGIMHIDLSNTLL